MLRACHSAALFLLKFIEKKKKKEAFSTDIRSLHFVCLRGICFSSTSFYNVHIHNVCIFTSRKNTHMTVLGMQQFNAYVTCCSRLLCFCSVSMDVTKAVEPDSWTMSWVSLQSSVKQSPAAHTGVITTSDPFHIRIIYTAIISYVLKDLISFNPSKYESHISGDFILYM